MNDQVNVLADGVSQGTVQTSARECVHAYLAVAAHQLAGQRLVWDGIILPNCVSGSIRSKDRIQDILLNTLAVFGIQLQTTLVPLPDASNVSCPFPLVEFDEAVRHFGTHELH
jgi:hypothetical protein